MKMNYKDLVDFKTAVNSVLSHIELKEKVLIEPLAVRLKNAALENPGDQTIHQLAAFLNSKAKKELLISKAELKDIYNKFYTSNTRCGSYIESEIGKTSLSEPTKNVRNDNEGTILDIHSESDPFLTSALASVFDKGAVYKPYSAKLAKSVETVCSRELSYFPVQPSKIEVIAGREDVLLCQASYETPKGQSHVLIPVEIKERSPLFPTVFVSDTGFETLSRENLGQHLVRNAGKNFKANVNEIFNVIKVAKFGLPEKKLNEVEEIVIKAELAKQTPAYSPNAILYQKVDVENGPGEELKLSANKEDMESFASKLSSTKGLAEITFGKKSVDGGRELIRKSLNSYGYKNVQVAVSNVTDDSIIYSVATGLAGLRVPVKFEKGLPITSIVLANGMIETFDKDGVDKLISSEEDLSNAALASTFYGEKSSSLIEVVKSAVINGELDKAEEALNVLAQSNDKNAYKYGLSMYMDLLNRPIDKTASSITKCSMQIKSPNSQHALCGHTNLPLNKVYQDEGGNCLPLYHKNIEHTNEGGSFLNSRIYFG
jgi:hypothetical protein